jgi:cytochrome b involved in lipid metabolism
VDCQSWNDLSLGAICYSKYMKNELFIGIAVLVFGVGIFLFTNQSKDTQPSGALQTTSPQQTTTAFATDTPKPTTITSKTITMTELAKHANENSCWMVINGNVYDVTKYISSHPGGNLILLGCGKDATDLFTGVAAMGKRHSSRAQSMITQLLVGPLVK